MNWKDAHSYCESIGNSWRMPSIDELNSLYAECKKDNALTNFNYAYYWSSTDNHVGGIKTLFLLWVRILILRVKSWKLTRKIDMALDQLEIFNLNHLIFKKKLLIEKKY